MSYKIIRSTTLLFILAFTLGLISCKNDAKKIKHVEISFKKEGELTVYKASTDSIVTTFDIEIADSEYEIQTGLMYRSSMKKNQGMLFVFPNVIERYFYMKNTQFPLDLIFIDEEKTVVSFQKNANPFDETSLPSGVPAKFVLEINSGLVDQLSINIGDRISF